MFEFFKNLFGSRPSEDGVSSRIESPAPRPAPTPSTSFRTRAAVATPPQPADPKASNILLPLQTVIESLPPEFKSRVQQMDLTGATLTISIDRIMAQLPTGAVKLSFGELRRAAPQLFSPENDLDEVPVPLPLSEILQRLHPAMLQRRSNQKRMDLPPDLGSPFGDRGQGLAFSISPARPAEAPAPSRAATPARPVPPRPVAPPVTPAAPAVPQQPAPVQPVARPPIKPSVPLGTPARHASPPAQPSPIAPAPVGRPVQPTPVVPPAPLTPAAPPVPPAPAAPPTPVASPTPTVPPAPAVPPQPAVPPAPVAPPPPIPVSSALRNLSAAIAAAPSNGAAAPQASAPVAPMSPISSSVPGAAPEAQPETAPAAPAAPARPPSTETVQLPVGLGAVAECWPEALKQEILSLNLTEARLAMPADLVEDSLKRGRVAFPWKTVRSWIKPAPPASASPHDNTVVELPLKLIMPLFLARYKAQKEAPRAQVAIDESIPNLFFGFPQADESPFGDGPGAPATSAHAVTKPVETNYYVWDDNADAALVDETEFKRKPSPETTFITRCATPNEVVSRAAALEGVAGALVALPDGLMVASKLSPELNGDTLAAFLPQIFGKVSQCTKELRMGELNNLHFTVGNVPWKIFRVNAIYFAAFGRPGQGLPTAQLAALAAELDHRKH